VSEDVSIVAPGRFEGARQLGHPVEGPLLIDPPGASQAGSIGAGRRGLRSNFEWWHLRDADPEGWARSIEVDEALRLPVTVAKRYLEQNMCLCTGPTCRWPS
jgi:hypothetical protein